ncbi:MAG: gas vesicle protein GvpO [Hyphomicrobiales bacterium]|jgi:hypothetical protein
MNTMEATKVAKEALKELIGRDAETVSRCEFEDKLWRVVVEIIENRARLSDNDLVADYEVILDLAGELKRYARLRRYRRADAARDAA